MECLLPFLWAHNVIEITQNTWYIQYRGNKMAVKVKPVQPTEIKDKKIARQVIEEIRKPIPTAVYKRLEKKAAYIDKFFK